MSELKVGDKIRFLEDNVQRSGVKQGDILEVTRAELIPSQGDGGNIDCGRWMFSYKYLGIKFVKVDDYGREMK